MSSQRAVDAAGECIRGLEDGYDELLVNAKSCLDRPEDISAVRRQIDRYLEVHQLRRILRDSTKGLEPLEKELRRRAYRYRTWHWRRRDKQDAVEEFAQRLKGLTDYLNKLEDHDLKHRPSGTGVAVHPLHEIYVYLGNIQHLYLRASVSPQDIPEEVKANLVDLIQKARADRSKDRLEPITGEINITIEKLKQQFR